MERSVKRPGFPEGVPGSLLAVPHEQRATSENGLDSGTAARSQDGVRGIRNDKPARGILARAMRSEPGECLIKLG